jgi:3-dehydroquinate synthase
VTSTSRSGSLVNPQIEFFERWPSESVFGSEPVLIYDRKLIRAVPGFQGWVKKFKVCYPVNAGESLKEIERFPHHIEKILELTRNLSPQTMSFVAVGGGSVGDFGGFVASIFKRGVTFYQVPSTWLAAIDSSHGGKTALNVGKAKNQVGTFYGASKIFIVKPLLLGQPEARIQDGLGELAKIAMIDGRGWTRDFLQVQEPTSKVLWKFLPQAIAAKYKVISQDPFETLGVRQILNLGHTMGHLFEILGPFSHGVAVGQGLYFALEWSHQRGLLTKKNLQATRLFLEQRLKIHPWPADRKKLRPKEFHNLLLKDKKRESTSSGKTSLRIKPLQKNPLQKNPLRKSPSLQFIFLRDWGRPLRELVTVDELQQEALRQGILRK